ncbi:MAG: RsmD family RNA methyltransferase [Planctomycetota bacterium]
MRIIGGEFKRTPIKGPPDERTTRPLPDRVRESIFNMLSGHMQEQPTVLDCFAGTGSFGLEALSRGARRAVFVERDRRIEGLLRGNIEAVGVADRCEVIEADALGPLALARCPDPVTIVMMDPPYAIARDPKAWQRVLRQASRFAERLTEDGYLLLRTPWPFLQIAEIDEPQPPTRRRSKGERPTPAQEEVIELSLDDGSLESQDADEIEALFEAIASADANEPAKPEFVRGSLEIDGTVGPETHEYGTTAVHWYQRQADG